MWMWPNYVCEWPCVYGLCVWPNYVCVDVDVAHPCVDW